MKVTQMPPVHEANLVASTGSTAFGVDVIQFTKASQAWSGLSQPTAGADWLKPTMTR